jgi:hypothetical protein
MKDRGTARTVHVLPPVTHRSLCGYEEEGPRARARHGYRRLSRVLRSAAQRAGEAPRGAPGTALRAADRIAPHARRLEEETLRP